MGSNMFRNTTGGKINVISLMDLDSSSNFSIKKKLLFFDN